MAEEKNADDRPLVERWLEEQQEWQKTMLRYMDSMAHNEEFLVHLGNAMRGSLLAGKPYPGTAASQPEAEPGDSGDTPAAADERMDRVLFALHEIQGQLNDLQLTVEGLAAAVSQADSQGSPDADRHTETAPKSGAAAPEAATSERTHSGKVSRTVVSSSDKPTLRRSQPRGGFSRRGGDAD